jgi:hypothetical protein
MPPKCIGLDQTLLHLVGFILFTIRHLSHPVRISLGEHGTAVFVSFLERDKLPQF